MSRTMRALVTGASGGVGSAVVRRLGTEGWSVLATGRSEGRLQRLAQPEASVGSGSVETVQADLCRTDDREGVYQAVRQWGTGLDALVLSHGIFLPGLAEDLDESRLQAALDANFASRVMLFRALLPALARRGGQVVVIGSTAALSPRPDAPLYAASMAATAEFFRGASASPEVLGRVGVCLVSLGRTATRMQDEVLAHEGRTEDPAGVLDPGEVADFVFDRLSASSGWELNEVVLRAARTKTRFASDPAPSEAIPVPFEDSSGPNGVEAS